MLTRLAAAGNRPVPPNRPPESLFSLPRTIYGHQPAYPDTPSRGAFKHLPTGEGKTKLQSRTKSRSSAAMPESTENPPAASPVGSNPPSTTSSLQISDLVEIRQKWDENLEASFAEIHEILRRSEERSQHTQRNEHSQRAQ